MTPPSPEQVDPQAISAESIAKALQRYTQLLAKSIARQIVREWDEQEAAIREEANLDND